MENEIINSENYINNKVGQKTGFSAPSNYFDTLEDVIASKISEENLPKETAFKTPENYFSNLEDSILAQVTSKEKEVKVISFKDRILKFIPIAAAASVVLFISLNSFVFNADEEMTLDALSDNDIEYWLDANTLNTNDIAAILEDDILEENEFSLTDIKDESIEDYINSIDNTSLLNELN
jgi:hypothetical protein